MKKLLLSLAVAAAIGLLLFMSRWLISRTDGGQGKSWRGFEKGKIDGIAYLYKQGSNGKAILFLHQLNGKKEDWLDLMEDLNSLNFTVMAIDLRGHGESFGDWKSFSEEDFKSMRDDVKKAMEFLRQRNHTVYGVVGASIGANLALNTDAPKVVALSPGLNYRGIEARKRDVLIIVGKGDSYSYESSIQLGTPAVYDCACHGKDLVPLAKELIIDYLNE